MNKLPLKQVMEVCRFQKGISQCCYLSYKSVDSNKEFYCLKLSSPMNTIIDGEVEAYRKEVMRRKDEIFKSAPPALGNHCPGY